MGCSSVTGTGVGSVPTYTTKQLSDQIMFLPRKYEALFANNNIVDGVLTVKHNLGVTFVAVYSVYNNNNEQIVPDLTKALDENTLLITLTSMLPITGTWHIIVIG